MQRRKRRGHRQHCDTKYDEHDTKPAFNSAVAGFRAGPRPNACPHPSVTPSSRVTPPRFVEFGESVVDGPIVEPGHREPPG